MGYALANDVTFCVVDDQIVFLSLGADRYHALPRGARDVFARLIDTQEPTAEDSRILNGLVANNVLVATHAKTSISNKVTLYIPPVRDAMEPVSNWRSIFAVPTTVLHLAWTAYHLRNGRLLNLVRLIELRKSEPSRRPTASIESVLSCFRSAALIMSPRDQCLQWSISTALRLLGHGHSPTLVFGVAMYPFRAHCWVQNGDRVLNDSVENVRQFEPILVI